VPLLLHGGKTCVETEAVLRYVDKTFPGDSLATNSGAVDKFLKLVAAVPHDDYVASAFLKAGNPGAHNTPPRPLAPSPPGCTLRPPPALP
jgi:hypothetical protein